MFGRISNAGIAIGVVLIVIGGIIAWFWLADADLAESPAGVPETGEVLEEEEGQEQPVPEDGEGEEPEEG